MGNYTKYPKSISKIKLICKGEWKSSGRASLNKCLANVYNWLQAASKYVILYMSAFCFCVKKNIYISRANYVFQIFVEYFKDLFLLRLFSLPYNRIYIRWLNLAVKSTA